MLTEQEHYTCVSSQLQSLTRRSPSNAAMVPPKFTPMDVSHDRLFEFAANAPSTLAERHPRLTVFAVSAAVLLAAIALEIDCLANSGYFWR